MTAFHPNSIARSPAPHLGHPPRAARRKARRRGVTLRDTIIGFAAVIILGALLIPLVLKLRERGRRMECQANLRNIGQAFGRYQALSTRRAFPVGSGNAPATRSAGTSWWLEILPYVDNDSPTKKWNRDIPDSGDFTTATSNVNVQIADGLQMTIFFCPSSELPLFADPKRFMSEVNRTTLGREPVGIPVPMYTAIAGSAPDGLRYDQLSNKNTPSGRNTRDSQYGILSASGAFPPNAGLEQAALSDQKAKIILVAEQSDYVRDTSLDPLDLYDVRSAWPRGAFMGTHGNYQQLRAAAEDVGGKGTERCWNISSVRYPLNFRDFNERNKKPGIVTDPPPPRPAKEGDEPPPLPPYDHAKFGPGHNNPLVSAHPGGVQMLMGDESVQFFNEDMDMRILILMSTRDDAVDINLP
jgi:hypothetical protein